MRFITSILLLFLSGCVVVSDNPLFDNADSVITDSLSGVWYSYDNDIRRETFKFIPQEDSSYRIEIFDTQGVFQEASNVRFGYINSVVCGSMYNEEKKEYAIITVQFDKNMMNIRGLSVNAIDDDLEKKQIPFRCSYISGAVTSIKMHGTTAQIHEYLKKKVKNTSYWTDPITLKRK